MNYLTKEEFKTWKRHISVAYVVVALAFVAGIWGEGKRTDHNIRRDLNAAASQRCIETLPTIKSYNYFLNSQIQISRRQMKLSLKRNDKVRAKIYRNAVKNYQIARLYLPTIEECKRDRY